MTEEKKDKFIESILEDDKPWLLITHKNCMDGVGCVLACYAVADKAQIKRPEVLFVQYGNSLATPDVTGMNVMIADFSFDRETLNDMEQKANSLVLIDHHTSSKEILEGLDFCHFDMSHSGAVLTHEFFTNTAVPILLQYIEDRDIWNWKLPYSKEINAFLALHSGNLAKYEELFNLSDDAFTNIAFTAGSSILMYQESIVKKATSHEFKLVNWGKYKVPFINTTTLISEIGNVLAEQYPFAVMYFFTQTEIVFSFRSTGDFDLTKLGVPLGHPNAAGRGVQFDAISIDTLFSCYDECGDLGRILMVATKCEIDIETFYNVYDNKSVDYRNNIFDVITGLDYDTKFKNNILEYLGVAIEIKYLRSDEIWIAIGETKEREHIETEGSTYSEVVKNIKDKLNIITSLATVKHI